IAYAGNRRGGAAAAFVHRADPPRADCRCGDQHDRRSRLRQGELCPHRRTGPPVQHRTDLLPLHEPGGADRGSGGSGLRPDLWLRRGADGASVGPADRPADLRRGQRGLRGRAPGGDGCVDRDLPARGCAVRSGRGARGHLAARADPPGGPGQRGVPRVRPHDHGGARPAVRRRVSAAARQPARPGPGCVRRRGHNRVRPGHPGISMNERWRRAAMTAVLGLVGPMVLYYALRALGLSVFGALLVGALLPVVGLVVGLLRGRRPDAVSGFWSILLLLALAVSLIGGDVRFLLARDALVTATVGSWFLISAWTSRPLALVLSRPLLEMMHRYPPGRWEQLWRDRPRFRAIWRRASVGFGIGTLADAAARVVMAYTLPVDLVPALSTALYLATSGVLLVAVNVYYARAGLWPMLFAPASEHPEPVGGSAEGRRP